MIGRALVVASALLASSGSAQESPDAAVLFGARQSVEQIDLSPDGQRVVYLTPGPGRSTVVLVQALSGNAPPVAAFRSDGDPERVRWCSFVANDRLICRISALIRQNPTYIPFERLVALDLDGGHPKLIGSRNAFQYDGAIIDWLPDGDGSVLMARGGGVDRVDVRTARSSTAEPSNARAGGYMTDGHGHVRIMIVPTVRGATGRDGSRIAFFYRPAAGGRWQPLGDYDTLTGEGLYPVGVDAELDSAYVLRKLDGRRALYRIRLDGSLASELVYANDEVDVDGVVTAASGTRVIGLSFADESRRHVYFDPAYAELARALGRAIPNLPLVDFEGSSLDGNRILVHAGSDSDPGRYFVYDRTSRHLDEILLVRPQLEHAQLAHVRAITYPAADGASVPAYLTLPPAGEGRNLPAIVLPHGGPEARDIWGFDWLAQYFAHLGYAVLQPNYRGSAGYGDQWLQQNGFRNWRTSIGDISAGARWLAQQGIADPRRLAIVGWSYGGYAALQSGVTEPDLFRAIVAIAPVTDLQQIKDDARMFTNSRNVAEYVGTGPHIREGSPLPNAERIRAPVLMFHGERDLNVPIGHSRRLDDALRDAGRSTELVVFPGLEHDLGDGDVRRQMLDRIRIFLAANVGS